MHSLLIINYFPGENCQHDQLSSGLWSLYTAVT